MKRNRQRASGDCRIVAGAAEVVALRSTNPTAPVVALVADASGTESVLAQLAGADVVLTGAQPASDAELQPGLDLAVRAARTIAQRRNHLAATSRHVGHDIAQALNVIGLTAEAAEKGRLDEASAFAQIRSLVASAGDDAWRAGRGYRSSSLIVTCVDLRLLLQSEHLSGIDILLPEQETLVLIDREWFEETLRELLANARRAGATEVCISALTSSDGDTINVDVSDDGAGFPLDYVTDWEPFSSQVTSDRLGLGLATAAERAAELGGTLTLVDPGRGGSLTQVRLALPIVEPRSFRAGPLPTIDPAAAQATILEGVVRHVPLDESLEDIVTAIESQLPGAVCSVLLLEDGRLHHGAGGRLPLAYREAIDGVAIGLGQGSCGTAAHTGSPVIASDVTTDHNWVDFRSIATEHGLRSCWSTPIVAAEDGETLGTFAVYTSTVWGPDDAAIRLVNRFTYIAAVAIEHHRLFGALAESEARFRGAFEGAAAGIALASLDGVVLKSNSALFEIFGRPTSGVAGASLLDFIEVDSQRMVIQSWSRLAEGEPIAEPDPVEVPAARPPTSSPQWLSLHTSLIPGEADRQPYLYIEVRDVTGAHQHLADLRAREAAEAANRAKTDFLALASHELRTPLNAILGFAQIMQLLELDEDQRHDSVEQIVNAGKHLRDLIDQLLDLSRIESGKLSIETAWVDAGNVVAEALELVGPLAAARDIELLGQRAVSQPYPVLSDHRCLRQVIINLLDNAVKYTPGGGQVEVAVTEPSPSVIRIAVADSGPGISPDSLDAIFEPFHRLDRATDSEGTGLGLALCARLMRELAGTIGVTSTVGLGSTFWIEVPTATADQATASSQPSDRPHATSVGLQSVEGSLLYIEDDPACVDVLRAALGLRPNITMRAVPTAEAGAAAIADGGLDLVLLDIGLPDRSGWELLDEIRLTNPRLPVVVLTAGAEAVPEVSTPPDHVFTKPVDVGDVLQAIDLACSGVAHRNLFAESVDT